MHLGNRFVACCFVGGAVVVGAGCASSRGVARSSPDVRGSAEPRGSVDPHVATPSRDAKASPVTPAATPAVSARKATAGASAAAVSASAVSSSSDSRCSPVYDGPVDQYVTVLDWGIPKLPQYPPEALLHNVSGMVKVRVVVGTDGSLCKAEVIDGPPLLHEAALQAASETRLRPAMKGGKPVAMQVVMPFVFNLPAAQPAKAATQTARRSAAKATPH